MRVGPGTKSSTSGIMDRFGSVVDRMNMELGSMFLNSLRFKTQTL